VLGPYQTASGDRQAHRAEKGGTSRWHQVIPWKLQETRSPGPCLKDDKSITTLLRSKLISVSNRRVNILSQGGQLRLHSTYLTYYPSCLPNPAILRPPDYRHGRKVVRYRKEISQSTVLKIEEVSFFTRLLLTGTHVASIWHFGSVDSSHPRN
jgi:hypothetical protein